MYSSDQTTHPFLYARVLGIFHVHVYRAGLDLSGADDTEPQLMQVLWVRWFDLDLRAPGGFKACRLHRLMWADEQHGAYGFVSPEDVLRGVHLIPAFAFGTTPSMAAGADDAQDDSLDSEEMEQEWKLHYVNM